MQPVRTRALPEDRIRSVPAYLETEVRAALRTRIRMEGAQNADVLLDALDGVDEDALRTALLPNEPAVEDGKAPRRARVAAGEAPVKVQTNFQLDGVQERWVDQYGESVGAPSRTALFNAALRLWLLHA